MYWIHLLRGSSGSNADPMMSVRCMVLGYEHKTATVETGAIKATGLLSKYTSGSAGNIISLQVRVVTYIADTHGESCVLQYLQDFIGESPSRTNLKRYQNSSGSFPGKCGMTKSGIKRSVR